MAGQRAHVSPACGGGFPSEGQDAPLPSRPSRTVSPRLTLLAEGDVLAAVRRLESPQPVAAPAPTPPTHLVHHYYYHVPAGAHAADGDGAGRMSPVPPREHNGRRKSPVAPDRAPSPQLAHHAAQPLPHHAPQPPAPLPLQLPPPPQQPSQAPPPNYDVARAEALLAVMREDLARCEAELLSLRGGAPTPPHTGHPAALAMAAAKEADALRRFTAADERYRKQLGVAQESRLRAAFPDCPAEVLFPPAAAPAAAAPAPPSSSCSPVAPSPQPDGGSASREPYAPVFTKSPHSPPQHIRSAPVRHPSPTAATAGRSRGRPRPRSPPWVSGSPGQRGHRYR